MVKENVVCNSCEKKEEKYFWRMEPGQSMACLACYNLKKFCEVVGAEPIEVEASLSKKRKVESKGKGKVKVRTPASRVLESTVVDVLQDILLELKEL